MYYALLLVGGLAGGFLAGMLGIGGGILYVLALPPLFLHLGFSPEFIPELTIANSLFATIFASASASYRHIRNENFYPIPVLLLGAGGGITSILIMHLVVEGAFYSIQVFNLFLVSLLGFMLWQLLDRRSDALGDRNLGSFPPLKSLGVGMAGGGVSALTGLGGGVIVVPMILKVLKRPIKQATSISMGFIGISALSVSIYNAFFSSQKLDQQGTLGYLVFPEILILVVGVVIGAQFGVGAAKRISNAALRKGFALFIGIVILRKLYEILNYYA